MKKTGKENKYTHLLIRKFKPLKQFPGMGLWWYRCPACRNWWGGFETQEETLYRALSMHAEHIGLPPYRHPGWPK